MVDLLDYMRGAVGPDGVNGKPVGVKHSNAHPGIFQVQRDGATRRWFQVKGAWNNPPPACDWEELWYDDSYIYRAVDTSRKPSEGGPYTLLDDGAVRGSKWIKRHMNVGDKFFRNPTVYPFDMATGIRGKAEGPAPTWIKLHAIHAQWQGVPDVAELHWLLHENDTTPAERTYYARDLGQIGFIGSGMETTPNGVFPDFPPAVGIPILKRKPAPWLPAMPADTGVSTDLRFVNPARYPHTVYSPFGWRDSPGKPGERDYHGGVDLTPSGPAPHPVHAARAGTVTLAGWDNTGYGNVVKVLHPGNVETLYAHLSRIDVTVGQQVTTATRVGMAGATGWATGVHLHFEARRDGKAFDPLPHLDPPESAPPVATPPAPEPEPQPELPDTPPVWEWQFDTAQQREAFGEFLMRVGEGIKAAPGRRIYVSVHTE